MEFFAEKKAEDFLEKEGFLIINRKFVRYKYFLKKALFGFKFPIVMKVSGNKIVHKSFLGGVKLGIKTYSQALHEFFNLSKIKGSNGVIIQETLNGIEVFFGIKKTSEFGHIILFGSGGTNIEKSQDIVFRVLPLNKDEVKKMIRETQIGKRLLKANFSIVEKTILKLCKLIENHLNIFELDINPFILKNKKGYIADARIVFD
jgi:acetyltransferase